MVADNSHLYYIKYMCFKRGQLNEGAILGDNFNSVTSKGSRLFERGSDNVIILLDKMHVF